MRKGNKFLTRLKERSRHTIEDWMEFDTVQKRQANFFVTDTRDVYKFVYKYYLSEHS